MSRWGNRKLSEDKISHINACTASGNRRKHRAIN